MSVNKFVSHEFTRPGYESLYDDAVSLPEEYHRRDADSEGRSFRSYSLWGFAYTDEKKWTPEIKFLNAVQSSLGPLDDNTRIIRRMIAGLVGCDNGIPVTIDEILAAIGCGTPPERPFHAGCWMSPGDRTTQPGHTESLRAIEDIIRSYLSGEKSITVTARFPYAVSFIARTRSWLGPRSDLSEIQRLMLERMLLPFEWFAKRSDRTITQVFEDCMGENGLGRMIDEQIEKLAALPRICPNYRREYKDRLNSINDDRARSLYIVACHIADCCCELSDCHHSLLRRIEKWIHGIGTGSLTIPTQIEHAEGTRLGNLLLGYALGLDRWLTETPMHFLQMDLSHIDLGFDPWPDIQRVYGNLGEDHSPVRMWLTASLWFTLALEPPASLYQWGQRHRELLNNTEEKGISIRTWIDGKM